MVTPPATTTPPIPKSGEGTISGTVTMGPTCPVERIPPDPNCAPRPYQTSIAVKQGNKIIKTITSNQNGLFSTNLKIGSYELEAMGAPVFPRCSPTEVKVSLNQSIVANISCDTGIR